MKRSILVVGFIVSLIGSTAFLTGATLQKSSRAEGEDFEKMIKLVKGIYEASGNDESASVLAVLGIVDTGKKSKKVDTVASLERILPSTEKVKALHNFTRLMIADEARNHGQYEKALKYLEAIVTDSNK